MNTEQERAEFEAWMSQEFPGMSLERCETRRYTRLEAQYMHEAFQAGRAALQSQDAEDAERYRWIAKQKDVWAVLGDEYNLASEYEGANNLTEAIDHARRIEENK